MSNAIDLRLAWLEALGLSASMMEAAQGEEQPGDLSCPITEVHTATNTPFADTQEGARSFRQQRKALWDVSQSTPLRHASAPPIEARAGPTPTLGFATTSPYGREQQSGQQHVSFTDIYEPWTTLPRAFQNPLPQPFPRHTITDDPMDYGPSLDSMKMPPPPPPPPSQNQLCPAKHNSSTVPGTATPRDTRSSTLQPRGLLRAERTDLPPQFRALYNASTVDPTAFAVKLKVQSLTVKPVSNAVMRRFVCSKDAIRTIASYLNERDAVSLAMSSASIYNVLDRSWWAAAFPQKSAQSAKISAWAYLWPNFQGVCQFCQRWSRIVLHEPSKAHVCLDCMQLPLFKVVKFSAARSSFELDGIFALKCFPQLPVVHDATALYYWVCHLEWLEAQCRKFDATSKVRQDGQGVEPVGKKRPVGKSTSKAKSKRKAKQQPQDATIQKKRSEKAADLQRSRKVATQKRTEGDKSDKSKTMVRISLRKRASTSTTLSIQPEDFGEKEGEEKEGKEEEPPLVRHRNPTTSFNTSTHKRRFPSTHEAATSPDSTTSDDDAQGDTDEDYVPHPTKRKPAAEALTVRRMRSKTSSNVLKAVQTESGMPHRRVKSSSALSDPSDEGGARQERMMEIMREVRQEYLEKEVKAMGAALPPLRDLPDQFVNGQWSEVQEQGIQANDFKAMARWMKVSGMLIEDDENCDG